MFSYCTSNSNNTECAKNNNTGLAKNFFQVFPYAVMEKPDQTFWSNQ